MSVTFSPSGSQVSISWLTIVLISDKTIGLWTCPFEDKLLSTHFVHEQATTSTTSVRQIYAK